MKMEKHLKTAKEFGDRAGEGRPYGNVDNAQQSLGDYRKAIEYHRKHLKIAIEVGDRAVELGGYRSLGPAKHSLDYCRKAIEYHEKHLKIAQEIGDRVRGGAYQNLGNDWERQLVRELYMTMARRVFIAIQPGQGRLNGNVKYPHKWRDQK